MKLCREIPVGHPPARLLHLRRARLKQSAFSLKRQHLDLCSSVLFNCRKLSFFVELCCWNKRTQNTSGTFAETQTLQIVTVGVLGGGGWFLNQQPHHHHRGLFKMYASPSPAQALTGMRTKWPQQLRGQADHLLLLIPATGYAEQKSSSTSPFPVTVKLRSCYTKHKVIKSMLRIHTYLKCHTCTPFLCTIMMHLSRKK